jgi:hypothetical protein
MKELFLHNWIYIVIGFSIALLGIIIQKFKLYSLIAGYNTSSEENKRKAIKGLLAMAFRNAFLIIGLVWVFIPIISDLLYLDLYIKILLVVAGHIGIIVWLLRIIHSNEKYKKKPVGMN